MSFSQYQKSKQTGGWKQAQLQQTVEVGCHQYVRYIHWRFSQPMRNGCSQERKSIHLKQLIISLAIYEQGRHCSWQYNTSVLIFIKLLIVYDWVCTTNKPRNSITENVPLHSLYVHVVVSPRRPAAEVIYNSIINKSNQCRQERVSKTAGLLSR